MDHLLESPYQGKPTLHQFEKPSCLAGVFCTKPTTKILEIGLTWNVSSDQNQIPAIQLINANKHYGSGKKKLPVLMGLDMEVER